MTNGHAHARSKLDESIPEAVAVIKDKGLDDLPEYLEPSWPLKKEHRLHFIDNLVAGL